MLCRTLQRVIYAVMYGPVCFIHSRNVRFDIVDRNFSINMRLRFKKVLRNNVRLVPRPYHYSRSKRRRRPYFEAIILVVFVEK